MAAGGWPHPGLPRIARSPACTEAAPMTTLSPPRPASTPPRIPDSPKRVSAAPGRADRIFDGILAGSSGMVLLTMGAVIAFLFWKGWPALHEAGLGLFTDKAWNPDAHP